MGTRLGGAAGRSLSGGAGAGACEGQEGGLIGSAEWQLASDYTRRAEETEYSIWSSGTVTSRSLVVGSTAPTNKKWAWLLTRCMSLRQVCNKVIA